MLILSLNAWSCDGGMTFCSKPQLTGTWREYGRNCTMNGSCSTLENALIMTVRPGGRLILQTGANRAEFILRGEVFYRVYSPETRLAFSFEVLKISRESLVIQMYNSSVQKQCTYAFTRIAEMDRI